MTFSANSIDIFTQLVLNTVQNVETILLDFGAEIFELFATLNAAGERNVLYLLLWGHGIPVNDIQIVNYTDYYYTQNSNKLIHYIRFIYDSISTKLSLEK